MRERIGEVILHLSLNKSPLKSGKYAAYIRVQYKALNRYYSCHSEFTLKEWEKFEKFPDVGHPAMITFKTFREAVKKLIQEEDFSFTNLAQLTRRSRKNSIQELIKEYEKELTETSRHKTASLYATLRSSLDRFLGGKQLPVTQFSSERCEAFLRWLGDTLGNGSTTISMKARMLTAILQTAVKGHLIPTNPMKSVQKPTWKKRNLTISDDSLSKLLRADEATIGEVNYRYLQYWIASYYGNGMNMKDLLLLKRSDIRDGEIVFFRKKTQHTSVREIHIPITPQLNGAISALSGGRKYILPDLEDYTPNSVEEKKRIEQIIKNVNKHLKDTCRILRISEKVTTGTARHTFATKLLRCGVPVEYISDAMGHSRISTTQNYLDGYTREQRLRAASLLDI